MGRPATGRGLWVAIAATAAEGALYGAGGCFLAALVSGAWDLPMAVGFTFVGAGMMLILSSGEAFVLWHRRPPR